MSQDTPDDNTRAVPPAPFSMSARSRVLLGLALLPGAILCAFLLGAHVPDPPTVGAFVLSRVLQVGAVVAIVALVGYLVFGFTSAAWCARAAWVVVGVAVAIGVSALTAALRPPADGRAVLAIAAATTVSAGAGVWLWRNAPRTAKLPAVGVAAAAVAGAILPVLQLVNSTTFTVARTQASMELAVDLHDLGLTPDGTRRFVRLEVTATNESTVRAFVIASDSTVCWWDPADPDDSHRLPSTPWERENCDSQPPINARSFIDADAPTTFTRAFLVPAGVQHVVAVVRTSYARGDRLALADRDDARPAPTLGPHVTAYQIQDESNFRALAQQDKYLVFVDDGGLSFRFATYDELAALDPHLDAPVCRSPVQASAPMPSTGTTSFSATEAAPCTRLDDPSDIGQYVGRSEVTVHYETWLPAEAEPTTGAVAPVPDPSPVLRTPG